jgi:hypothetical protein
MVRHTQHHHANEALNIKVKEASDVEGEEKAVLITFPEIKAEPEVSCMSTVTQITQMCRNASCLSDLHLCLYT